MFVFPGEHTAIVSELAICAALCYQFFSVARQSADIVRSCFGAKAPPSPNHLRPNPCLQTMLSKMSLSMPHTTAALAAHDDDLMFQPMPSVKFRWKHLPDGIQMVDKAFEVYAVSQSATLEWFGPDDNPLIVPHPDNMRAHKHVIAKYKKYAKIYGVIQGVRGQPWCVLSTDNRPPYKMLTWGSLSRAVYEALKEDPTNEALAHSIKKGLVNVATLSTLIRLSFTVAYVSCL
jgi:hypothetical protein